MDSFSWSSLSIEYHTKDVHTLVGYLTQISRNTVFLKSQNLRNAGTLCTGVLHYVHSNLDGIGFRQKERKNKSHLFQFSESEHMGFKKSNFNWATIVHIHEKQYPVSFDKHSSS